MADTDAFDELEHWLANMAADLAPPRRVALARKVGQVLRKLNAARVAANLTPEGLPMAPRKAKPPRKTKAARPRLRQRQKSARMFKRIELARNMTVKPSTEGVSLGFTPRVRDTAAIHHFGLVAPVDPRIPRSIAVRYPERPLLGFSAADRDMIMAEVMEWLAK
ncbi:phage virion morphogenesis protein [Novosphingobium nitrogenifigens DSM 19370]|uniref:Phage virion morphogenesis protein n=1 Tax=Novosphingobium nitrogenifigens DSM 19370 TaxID=983920 RepID=F1Z9A8_9SPHN|nr:phage virion morphogenesis protein [Novosphingobium nitrogenifigens]EGD58397.1 phage virion morphogenesis protein [Novosphingobium nitrogenifigens DSM 19370]